MLVFLDLFLFNFDLFTCIFNYYIYIYFFFLLLFCYLFFFLRTFRLIIYQTFHPFFLLSFLTFIFPPLTISSTLSSTLSSPPLPSPPPPPSLYLQSRFTTSLMLATLPSFPHQSHSLSSLPSLSILPSILISYPAYLPITCRGSPSPGVLIDHLRDAIMREISTKMLRVKIDKRYYE